MRIKPKTKGIIQLAGLCIFFAWGAASVVYGNYKAYQELTKQKHVSLNTPKSYWPAVDIKSSSYGIDTVKVIEQVDSLHSEIKP